MGRFPRERISRREFMADAGLLATVGVVSTAAAAARDRKPEETPNALRYLHDSRRHWLLGLDPASGVTHFGLDSEQTGRENTNLLAGVVMPAWPDANTQAARWESTDRDRWVCTIPCLTGKGIVTWTVSRQKEDLIWRLAYAGEGTIANLRIGLPINALLAAAVLIPARVDELNHGLGPWLLVAPDFGHLLIEAESPGTWFAINDGARGGSAKNAPREGVDPRLRGQAWLDAVQLPEYRPGKLSLQFASEAPLGPGALLTLRFRPQELSNPEEVPARTWKRIRRAYLNHWQPCGTWCEPERAMVLANNVLSDPASISLWFYSEPMIFCAQPLPGIDLRNLLRRSLDYWLDHGVSAQGHVNAFGAMYDLYVSAGACLLVAAWDYWTVSQDAEWLKKRIPVLDRMGDYLLRRDIDGDGLVESYGGGNAGTLRDPERADIWFEMMNFGHKNTWTNAITYRAFRCLAAMLDAANQPGGATRYRERAAALREAYVRQFLSAENGWFVSWISQDGQVHDYCHTFINGLAVAYGIVGPEQGRDILSRVMAKSRSIGFTNWKLGVPGNLLPCRKADMIGPRIGLDGKPVQDDFYWPDGLTEEQAFGHRYPNGTIHPVLTWPYLLGLQVAGLEEEAGRILDAMIESAEQGLFQNGIVNVGYGGAEHFYIDGRTCGYEGYLPENYNFLMAAFTQNPKLRARLLEPVANPIP